MCVWGWKTEKLTNQQMTNHNLKLIVVKLQSDLVTFLTFLVDFEQMRVGSIHFCVFTN